MPNKQLTGTVVSNKMEKTVSVAVERVFRHPRYQKLMRRTKKYLAHSAEKLPEGAKVTIEETRPISRRKCWRVISVK